MNEKEIRSLIDRALEDGIGISFSLYRDAINNNHFDDAILVSFLMYLRRQMNCDPESLDALELLNTTIELCLAGSKSVIKNNPARETPSKGPYCSFCGKNGKEAQKLIAGPSVFICNECVGVCVGILKEMGSINNLTPLRKKVLTGRRKMQKKKTKRPKTRS